MSMSVQILSTCRYEFQPLSAEVPGETKKIVLKRPDMPHPNVVVRYVFSNQDGDNGKFVPGAGISERGPIVMSRGVVYLAAFLKPAFLASETGGDDFYFNFGENDGKAGELPGDKLQAATVKISFQASGDSNFQPPEDKPAVRSFPPSLIPNEAKLNLADQRFASARANKSSVKIEIPAVKSPGPKQNPFYIEQSVVIHVLNQEGHLICTMDLDRNQSITLSEGTSEGVSSIEDITLLALISLAGQDDRIIVDRGPDRSKGLQAGELDVVLNFKIGDPVTDASVTVSSRNP